jgi:hypothetical protein
MAKRTLCETFSLASMRNGRVALLACTMAAAALILAFVAGRPQDASFPAPFFIGRIVFWWNRRNDG